MSTSLPLDELIERLRARAADPDRRTSVQPSEFTATVRTMDLGSMLSSLRSLAGSLKDVVDANQQGRVDEHGRQGAIELERQFTTRAPSVLPRPADASTIAAAEQRFGHALPPAVRRVYTEVANGGFGPAEGLVPIDAAVMQYEELRSPGMMPRGRAWPDGLLPLVSRDPGWDCVDAATGRVVEWDPEELSERSTEAVFQRSFRESFASVEEWLSDWLSSKTQAEQMADMEAHIMAPESQVRDARAAREAIGRMSVAERRAMGLPDVGWEKVVWGGIGWEEPDAARE